VQIHVNSGDLREVPELLSANVRADYVYSYPPRQAYRRLSNDDRNSLREDIQSSLGRSDDLNVYVHVPFCHQICSFCNLYATVHSSGRNIDEEYVESVLKEMNLYEPLMDRKIINTLYIGGGTPSLLDASLIERMIVSILEALSRTPNAIPAETALEVDPATVDDIKLRDLRNAGINRINLGYQSMMDLEVTRIGRKRPGTAGLGLLEDALNVGFDNVCVDLIYGLQGQTHQSWIESLSQVVKIGPPTICAYALTLRPLTGYHKRGYQHVDGTTLHERYHLANDILCSAGYRRETHVRWVRDQGGYRQKVNHWSLQNVLGVGAGARSYLWHSDLRNGYSIRSRNATLQRYMSSISQGEIPATDRFTMSSDERMRKAVVLNVGRLDRTWFSDLFGIDPIEAFPTQFKFLQSLGAFAITDSTIELDDEFSGHRDLISQCFFSERVSRQIQEFDYDELQANRVRFRDLTSGTAGQVCREVARNVLSIDGR